LCQLVFGDHLVIGDVCVGVMRQVVAASRSSVIVMASPHAGHSPPVPTRRAEQVALNAATFAGEAFPAAGAFVDAAGRS